MYGWQSFMGIFYSSMPPKSTSQRKKDVCKERGPLCLLYSALPEVPKWFFGDGVLTTMKMLTFVTVNYNKNQYRGFGVLEPLCGGLNLPTKLESLGNNNWTSGIAPASTWELFPFSLLFCQSSWLYYPCSNHGSGTWIIITSQFLIQQKIHLFTLMTIPQDP